MCWYIPWWGRLHDGLVVFFQGDGVGARDGRQGLGGVLLVEVDHEGVEQQPAEETSAAVCMKRKMKGGVRA